MKRKVLCKDCIESRPEGASIKMCNNSKSKFFCLYVKDNYGCKEGIRDDREDSHKEQQERR